MNKIPASKIASFLEATLFGTEFLVNGVSSLQSPRSNTVSFRTVAWDATLLPMPILVIASSDPVGGLVAGVSVIKVSHPRQAYAKVIERFFSKAYEGVAPTAILGNRVQLGKKVYIDHGAIIGDDVIIGDNTYIGPGAFIGWGTKIGTHCRVGEGAVIGNEGLGTFESEDGQLSNIRHLGCVNIADNVEIGALSAVARGTIDDTIVGANTHIGPMVNVGHNAVIGERCQIAGRSHISGSVNIKNDVKLWANCTLRDGITIGAAGVVGMGANVERDVPPGHTVAVLPAIGLRKLAQFVHYFKWGRS